MVTAGDKTNSFWQVNLGLNAWFFHIPFLTVGMLFRQLWGDWKVAQRIIPIIGLNSCPRAFCRILSKPLLLGVLSPAADFPGGLRLEGPKDDRFKSFLWKHGTNTHNSFLSCCKEENHALWTQVSYRAELTFQWTKESSLPVGFLCNGFIPNFHNKNHVGYKTTHFTICKKQDSWRFLYHIWL